MAQANFLGAMNNVDALNCCNALSLANVTVLGMQEYTPLLQYSKIIRLEDSAMGASPSMPFSVSETETPRMMDVDPCTRTKHEPSAMSIRQRFGELKAKIASRIDFDLAKACCNTGFRENVVREYIRYMTQTTISMFSRAVDEVYFQAFNQGISVSDGVVQMRPYASGSNGKMLDLTADGVVTYDASTTGLTFETVQNVLTELSLAQNYQSQVLFIVPPGAVAKYRTDSKEAQIITENSYYNGIPVTRCFGNDMYVTHDPLNFFPVRSNVPVKGGTTVSDVVIGYAVPMDSMVFGYVNHDIPPINGFSSTIGMSAGGTSEDFIPGSSSMNNITSMMNGGIPMESLFKARMAENPYPMLLGLNTRIEAMIGAMRGRKGALVRIALPKSDVGK